MDSDDGRRLGPLAGSDRVRGCGQVVRGRRGGIRTVSAGRPRGGPDPARWRRVGRRPVGPGRHRCRPTAAPARSSRRPRCCRPTGARDAAGPALRWLGGVVVRRDRLRGAAAAGAVARRAAATADDPRPGRGRVAGGDRRRRPHPLARRARDHTAAERRVRDATCRDDEAAGGRFDMAAFNDLVSIAGARRLTSTPTSWRDGASSGYGRVLPLLDENAWSPMEPVMRLAWHADDARGRGLLIERPGLRPEWTLRGHARRASIRDAGVYGMYDGGAAPRRASVRHSRRRPRRRPTGGSDSRASTMMAGDLVGPGPFRAAPASTPTHAPARRPAADRAVDARRRRRGGCDTHDRGRAPRTRSAYDRARLLAHRRAGGLTRPSRDV